MLSGINNITLLLKLLNRHPQALQGLLRRLPLAKRLLPHHQVPVLHYLHQGRLQEQALIVP
jgi:hypothetical protein